MNARMPVVASIAFAALIHPLTVGAQPVVSSVSQQTSGSTPVLVVSGSQFGTHGNFNPSGTGGFLNAAWRDFEDGQFNGGNMFLDVTSDSPNLFFVIDRSGSMGQIVEGRMKYDAVASAGYYGRDTAGQRGRIEAQHRPMAERVENGQLLAGSPDTVLAQARRIRDEVGAGILEVAFTPLGRERTLRAIELFGTAVLPRLRDI